MSKSFNTNTENKDEWLTDPDLIKNIGEFDLDPCSPIHNKRPWPTAKRHLTLVEDGLIAPWHATERVFCNPPYGRETFKWIGRLSHHGNGVTLIFARTETKGFHKFIWNKADGIFFFKGRLRFYHVNGTRGGTANAPSCLISYGNECTEMLKNFSWKEGKFLDLRSLK